jgi:hypothetical protein
MGLLLWINYSVLDKITISKPGFFAVKKKQNFICCKLDAGSDWGAGAEDEQNQHQQEEDKTNVKGAIKRFGGSHDFCEHGFLLTGI